MYNTVVTIAGAVVVGGVLLYVGYRLGEAGEEQQPSPPSERIQAEAPQPAAEPGTGAETRPEIGPEAGPPTGPQPAPREEAGPIEETRPDQAERPPSGHAEAQTPTGEDRLIAPEGPPAPQLAQREAADTSLSAPLAGPVPAPSLAPRTGSAQAGDAPLTPYAWATASDVGYRLGPDGVPLSRKPRAEAGSR